MIESKLLDTYLVKVGGERAPHRVRAHGWNVSSEGLKFTRQKDGEKWIVQWFTSWDWFKYVEAEDPS